MGLRRNVDYIAENAIKNINSVAKVPKRNLVDSRRGNKQRLEVSGLEPNFVFKKVFEDFNLINSFNFFMIFNSFFLIAPDLG